MELHGRCIRNARHSDIGTYGAGAGSLADRVQKDPVAILTGIFTGDGKREWVFYSVSTHIFGKKLNQALEPFPLLPITVYCENDPGWEGYDEMTQAEIRFD